MNVSLLAVVARPGLSQTYGRRSRAADNGEGRMTSTLFVLRRGG